MQRDRALASLLGLLGPHTAVPACFLEPLYAHLSSFQSKTFEARKDHAVLFFVYCISRAKIRVVKVYYMNSDYVSGQVKV